MTKQEKHWVEHLKKTGLSESDAIGDVKNYIKYNLIDSDGYAFK